MDRKYLYNSENPYNDLENSLFYFLYVTILIFNIVFVIVGDDTFASLNLIAAVSIAISLWYFPE